MAFKTQLFQPHNDAIDLIAIYNFKTLRDTKDLLYYEDGYYHYDGETIIDAECERVFGEYMSIRRDSEITHHVRSSTYTKREKLNNDLWALNLENGVLNTKTFEFTQHTPDLFTTIRIPIEYNQNAECPTIKKFISEIVYAKDIPTIEEMIGYCLYHDYTYQNWFLLHGEGENGKSKLLALISRFLGKENVSSIGLQDLNQRFAPVNLYAKSANVVADLSDEDLKRTARLKQLTGGDLITAEPKFKDAFTYYNFATLIYSCNKVPLTEDKSRAFFRRVIFIPFPNRFVVGDNADEHILEKLTTKEELSGFLNMAITALKRLLNAGGFSGTLTAEENEELYERASNPVYGFFHDWCGVDIEKCTPKVEFYDGYCEYCKGKKVVAYSEKKFVEQMRLLTKMESGQRGSVGHQKRVWMGILVTHKQEVVTTDLKVFIYKHHKHHKHHFPHLTRGEEKNKSIMYGLNGKNPAYGAYGAYLISELSPELLNPSFENLGNGECEGCHEQKGDLWSVKIGNTIGGYCIDCIKDAIEQLCEKKEEEAKEPEKQEKLVKTEETKEENKTPLVCICGKRFDTIKVLHEHQAKCKEFQANQDREAKQ